LSSSFHDHVIEVGLPHEIGKLLHQFLLLFALCPTFPLSTTPVSFSALDPLLLSKLFLGEQLQISAPRVFSNGELWGLADHVPAV